MNWNPLTRLTGIKKARWNFVKGDLFYNYWYKFVYLISDAYILSYPRSGRTWLKTMLCKIIQDTYGIKKHNIYLFKMTLFTKAPNIVSEHPECSDYPITDNYSSLQIPKKFAYSPKKKVIFLFRDPRDLVVSNYFEYTTRKKVWQGELKEFIRRGFGLRRILDFYNLWHPWCINNDDSVLCLYYERTKKDPSGELRKVCDFLGIPATDKIIQDAVDFGSVENMKKLEKADFFSNDKIRPADKDNPDSYKVRKAKAGGYKEYLSNEDIEWMDELIKRYTPPSFHRRYYDELEN